MIGNHRRFAILEHEWDGVHWDFLVEDGPMLRTWAIDSPISEGVDLPARALAAHRPIYLTFEGDVSGGRGTVRRWDSGVCEVVEWGERRVRLTVQGGQLVGSVELWCVDEEEGRVDWRFRFGKLS
jgi:DNA polymerase Ligase (LigD)